MRQRPLNVVLLLVALSALILGFASTPVPAYADGAGGDPPPPHKDPGDTTGGGSSVPDYPSGSGDASLNSEAEPTLWDVVLFTLNAII